MNNKIYQVFVSSTFKDLEEAREAVSNTLAKAGHIAAGMELFPATDMEQFEYIKRVIDRSDYYVVIVAGRYGSVSPTEGISYTEMEYNYAMSKGIPVLAFLHKDPESIPYKLIETDVGKREKLEAFRQKLSTNRIRLEWTTKEELCLLVSTSVSQQINLKPGVGWIRGDQAFDPQILQELERLRIENEELERRLGQEEISFDETYVGPDGTFLLGVHGTVEGQRFRRQAQTSLGDLFVELYEAIRVERFEHSIEESVGAFLLTRIIDGVRPSGKISSIGIADNELVRIRHQLEALGLITTDIFNESSIIWVITPKGTRYFLSKVALRK